MTTAWSHLPNADHIDRILASVKVHPDIWQAEWDASRLSASTRIRPWRLAWDATRGQRGEAWARARLQARFVDDMAMVALIAWDHSAQYLSMPSDQLRVWAILSDDPACVLLLPAVIAFEKIKELEVA